MSKARAAGETRQAKEKKREGEAMGQQEGLRALIIGGGMAGRSAAKEIRKALPQARLILVTEDSGEAYAKPMLSNAFSKGAEAAGLVSQSAQRVALDLGLELRARSIVKSVDLERRRAALADGEEIEYDALIFACGADPIRLSLGGDAADRALAINHLEHYAELRRRLESRSGRRAAVAIMGAGLIGCEFADDLLSAGHPVSLIDPGDRPLRSISPPEISEGLRSALAAKGAQWFFGASVLAVRERGDGGVLLELSDGRSVEADELISAVGLRPRAELARAAGLRVERGIRVGAGCQTSHPGVYALGDCAEYEAGGLGRVMPYVAPILAGARAIAQSLAEGPRELSLPDGAVVVKTPSYPLAVRPPAPGAAGEWESQMEQGRLVCRFKDASGRTLGFGIAPHDAASRKRLEAELAPLEEPAERP